MPEKNVDAAVNARSICPAVPCFTGPAGCGSRVLILLVRPAPKSARASGGIIFGELLIVDLANLFHLSLQLPDADIAAPEVVYARTDFR